jgi:hypothetical protein
MMALAIIFFPPWFNHPSPPPPPARLPLMIQPPLCPWTGLHQRDLAPIYLETTGGRPDCGDQRKVTPHDPNR